MVGTSLRGSGAHRNNKNFWKGRKMNKVIATCLVVVLFGVGDICSGSVSSSNTMQVTVAASNAPAWQKIGADYQCSGASDDAQIQAAINQVSTTGGIVNLSAGTFYISSPIVPQNGVTVVGVPCVIVGAFQQSPDLSISITGGTIITADTIGYTHAAIPAFAAQSVYSFQLKDIGFKNVQKIIQVGATYYVGGGFMTLDHLYAYNDANYVTYLSSQSMTSVAFDLQNYQHCQVYRPIISNFNQIAKVWSTLSNDSSLATAFAGMDLRSAHQPGCIEFVDPYFYMVYGTSPEAAFIVDAENPPHPKIGGQYILGNNMAWVTLERPQFNCYGPSTLGASSVIKFCGRSNSINGGAAQHTYVVNCKVVNSACEGIGIGYTFWLSHALKCSIDIGYQAGTASDWLYCVYIENGSSYNHIYSIDDNTSVFADSSSYYNRVAGNFASIQGIGGLQPKTDVIYTQTNRATGTVSLSREFSGFWDFAGTGAQTANITINAHQAQGIHFNLFKSAGDGSAITVNTAAVQLPGSGTFWWNSGVPYIVDSNSSRWQSNQLKNGICVVRTAGRFSTIRGVYLITDTQSNSFDMTCQGGQTDPCNEDGIPVIYAVYDSIRYAVGTTVKWTNSYSEMNHIGDSVELIAIGQQNFNVPLKIPAGMWQIINRNIQ